MYYEYWGLHKPAFDNVPDPSMYVDCHTSMETAIAETLFAIEEGNECMAVIVGDVGLGKTMSLRMIIDSLNQEKYRMALVTNPGISFTQVLQEIIGQLTGKQCLEKRKVQLLETFNRLLFSTLAEGRKILIFIDEANAITPVNLENLRLLTNMQGDGRNLFTMVLAGQIEFARRLEHPKRANLFQRVGTYCRIDRLESIEKVRQYVETRLALAGATKMIFTDDTFERLWEQSDHGVPRLVNKLCKLCLKAGETNHFASISGEMVDQIGERFHKLAGPALQQRKSRPVALPEEAAEAAEPFDEEIEALAAVDEERPEEQEEALVTAGEERLEEREQEPPPPLPVIASPVAEETAPASPAPPTDALSFTPAWEDPVAAEPEQDTEAEMCIGQVRIRIQIPLQIMKQSLSASREHRYKMASGLAAETLKNHPQLLSSLSADPVPIWMEIRDFVLAQMTHGAGM